LADIVEAAEAIKQFLRSTQRAQFLENDLQRSAVLHKLTIIGEAAARLSQEFRKRNSQINWADIVAFRNIAVHAYFSVDWSIVWDTAINDVPPLAEEVRAMLKEIPND
jgi:uncharacterized protein with HEPN domain